MSAANISEMKLADGRTALYAWKGGVRYLLGILDSEHGKKVSLQDASRTRRVFVFIEPQ